MPTTLPPKELLTTSWRFCLWDTGKLHVTIHSTLSELFLDQLNHSGARRALIGARSLTTMSTCSRVFILVLCCLAGLTQNASAAKSEAVSNKAPFGGILDPATYFFGFFYQIFPANIDVIFPFTILPRLNPSLDFFRLNRCPRAMVPSCLPVGTPWLYHLCRLSESVLMASG